MNYRILVFVFCVFLIFAPNKFALAETSLANPGVDALFMLDEQTREAQRATFLRAERRVWSMSNDDLLDVISDLDDYPLVPYLIAKKLSHRMTLRNEDGIRAFLQQYGDTVIARKLRRDWLEYLAKRDNRKLFMEFYYYPNNAELQCTFLRYQYEIGIDKEEIFSNIPSLWNVGQSQTEVCDPIFKVWMKDGHLTEDLILHRIEKAADGGQHTLIPYLRSLLPEDKRYVADRWQEVRKNPANVRHLVRYTGKLPNIEADIVSYGLSRLIWRDRDLALRTYERARQRVVFSDAQRARIIHRFAVALALDEHPQAETWLIEASQVEPESETMRWHLAYLLKKQQWQSIALLIEKSPPQLTNENQFQYWLARAYEKLGRIEQATVLYQQLAHERHYYGFLASARLEVPHNLQNRPINVSSRDIEKVVNLASTERAYELRQLGRYYQARLEWNHTQRQLEDDEKIAAAEVSSAWGWHDQSIFTLSRVGYLDDVDKRFPTAFAELLTREAEKNNIPPEWAFAIARRESSFMTDAVSSANARGLMQILPSTARYLEKRRISSNDLLDANTNARIGNKYLRYLMNKLDNNSLLATASYNAGWRAVSQWLPESEPVPADIWVETIPYRETRNYVKAVLAYQQIYEDKLSKKPPEESVFAAFSSMELQAD